MKENAKKFGLPPQAIISEKPSKNMKRRVEINAAKSLFENFLTRKKKGIAAIEKTMEASSFKEIKGSSNLRERIEKDKKDWVIPES